MAGEFGIVAQRTVPRAEARRADNVRNRRKDFPAGSYFRNQRYLFRGSSIG